MKELEQIRESLEKIFTRANDNYNWLIVNWELDGETIADEVQPAFGAIKEEVGKVIDRLEKRLQWKPIETAPRDGTEILVNGGAKRAYSSEVDRYVIMDFFNGEEWQMSAKICHAQPTHWMELPEAPE